MLAAAPLTFQSNPSEAPQAPVDLVALAASRSNVDRIRLLNGMLALCSVTPPSGQTRETLAQIFLTIARDAERDIRQALADGLAEADWAPRGLIQTLSLDEIEIARPVIARSPLLDDEDLMRILIQATVEHQIEVARRPHISGRVVDGVIDAGHPGPLTALVANPSAEIGEGGLARLIEQARRTAALRAPLSRHRGLTRRLARDLYALVGEALREEIDGRFQVDSLRLNLAISKAVDRVVEPPRPAMTTLLDMPAAEPHEREEMNRRLVDKLQASRQLRPGFLIRAVREKHLGLFEHGLAALSGLPLSHVRQAVRRGATDALYLACAGVGIDKAVFPTLLIEVRRLTGGLPGDSAGVWAGRTLSPPEALQAFRLLIDGDTDDGV